MAITSQQQRIPLVDPQTGLIRREWLTILFGNDQTVTADIAALADALAAALEQLAAIQAEVDALPTAAELSISEMVFTPLSTAIGTSVNLDSLLCDETGRLLLDNNGLILTDA